MQIRNILTTASVLAGALLMFGTGSAHADTPDNYAGVAIQTDDSVIGVFGKYEIKELDGSGFLDGISARPSVFFDDDVNGNISVTADKDVTGNLTAFAGPVLGFDTSGDDTDVNVGVALGADYQIGRSNFVANGTAILGSSDSSIRLGIGYGF